MALEAAGIRKWLAARAAELFAFLAFSAFLAFLAFRGAA
jgi:hypothetical protein